MDILQERGGRNLIQGDLTSHQIMDYAIQPIQRAGGGGGGAVQYEQIAKTGDLIFFKR